MPIRTKRLVVEKWMETKRFDEERDLLKREMSNYLMFYKTLVFRLRQRNNELESLHSGIQYNNYYKKYRNTTVQTVFRK